MLATSKISTLSQTKRLVFLERQSLIGDATDLTKQSEFSPRPRAKSSYFDFSTFKTIQKYQVV